MFNEVDNGLESSKKDLLSFNNKIDEGEQMIMDTNSNIRTDEILKTIETLQQQVNSLHDSITTINDDIASLRSDIETSKSIRQQEIQEENKLEVEEIVDVDLD